MENYVKFLWDCAHAIKLDNGAKDSHVQMLLKSHYMNICRKIARKIETPKEKFSNLCTHCGLPWSEIDFQLKLKHRQVTMSKAKTKKILEKLEKSKESECNGLFKRNERQRSKWLKKHINNRMEIFCKHCNKKTSLEMSKPKLKVQTVGGEQNKCAVATIIDDAQKIKTKKKKKSKNKTAGLIISQNNISKTIPVISQSIVPSANPFKTTSVATSSAKQKQKKIKGNNKPTTPTLASKTQKNNSILQLAALLRQQSSSSSNTSAQNKLESFLR